MKEQQTGAEEFGWSQGMGVSLHDKIKLDLKNAMLLKRNEIRDTIRVIMGEYPKLTVPITLESGKKTFRVKKPVEITDDDLLGLTELRAQDAGITDLSGLERCTNLKTLDLFNVTEEKLNSVTDISPLAGLRRLEYLNVENDLGPGGFRRLWRR